MASAGYLCTVKGKLGGYKVVKVSPPERLPARIVDRISVALWLLGLDRHKYIPRFNVHVECEIQRIVRLPPMQRMEQAIKLVRRYRDAEEIVEALTRARSGDIAAEEIKHLSAGFKTRARWLAGLEERKSGARSPSPAKIKIKRKSSSSTASDSIR
jgi:hypothetical protein